MVVLWRVFVVVVRTLCLIRWKGLGLRLLVRIRYRYRVYRKAYRTDAKPQFKCKRAGSWARFQQ